MSDERKPPFSGRTARLTESFYREIGAPLSGNDTIQPAEVTATRVENVFANMLRMRNDKIAKKKKCVTKRKG